MYFYFDQLEATWCITNICAGSKSHIESLVSKGLFEILPKILRSPHQKIFEQGAWAVGNISADDPTFKEVLLKYEVLEILVSKIISTPDQDVLKYTSWALCNLVKGGSRSIKKRLAITALIKLLLTQQDFEIIDDCLSALLDLLDDSLIQILIDAKLNLRLVEFLRQPSTQIVYHTLQIISFITNGTDTQTQSMIECGVLPMLFNLLQQAGLDLMCRRECLWIISNITVGTFQQMKLIFENKQWVEILFNHCSHESTKIKREAVWALCNSTKNADAEHIGLLIDKGILHIYNTNLDHRGDSSMIKTILESLAHILIFGKPDQPGLPNKFQAHLETCGIVDRIENLQLHPVQSVYQCAINLIEAYFLVHDPI